MCPSPTALPTDGPRTIFALLMKLPVQTRESSEMHLPIQVPQYDLSD